MALTWWNKYHPRPQRQPETASIVGNNDDATSAEVLPTRVPAHFEYAEQAKQAGQRYFEQAAHIDQLTTECDDWRSRALAAENEVARLLEREAALLVLIEGKSNAALKQVEEYKTILTGISAQYGSVGKVLLGGLAALDKAGLRVSIGLPSLAALAAALTKSGARVVTEEPGHAEPVSRCTDASVAGIERRVAEIAASLRSVI
jgi:hypothetical protein